MALLAVVSFEDGILWVAAANLVIWTGLFLYLRRLDRKLSRLERESRPGQGGSS